MCSICLSVLSVLSVLCVISVLYVISVISVIFVIFIVFVVIVLFLESVAIIVIVKIVELLTPMHLVENVQDYVFVCLLSCTFVLYICLVHYLKKKYFSDWQGHQWKCIWWALTQSDYLTKLSLQIKAYTVWLSYT